MERERLQRVRAQPTWQKDTGCLRRTVADVAADADPSTGAAVFDSVLSGPLRLVPGGRN
jgi:hypothetical protein